MTSRALQGVVGLGVTIALMTTVSPSAIAAPADAQSPLPTKPAGRYIVLMKDAPVANYTGNVKGFEATKPQEGEKLQPASAAAHRYRSRLQTKQAEVRAELKVPNPIYTYTTAANGFAADLTSEQATKLSANSNVLGVFPNEMLQTVTDESPKFLGLEGDRGLWKRIQDGPKGLLGRDIVVGVVDTGIRHDNPAFADNGRLSKPTKFKGGCFNDDKKAFPDSACTNKLVGARYYNKGNRDLAPHETQSALDYDGHGSHTASTAVGNRGVLADFNDKKTPISGMAPDAHVAAYKICWDDSTGKNGCATADSVAAIDDAVADGVDVINYSISGNTSMFVDPVAVAFLNAAAAGVFVAAAGGNSGPAVSTVNHPSPWLTTVANSTHKVLEATFVDGNGKRYIGASLGATLPSTPMVFAGDIAKEGKAKANLCLLDSLDEAKAKGKLVVCERGENARVEKSAEVKRAGGLGMLLLNITYGGTVADAHSVPSVHLESNYYEDIKAYLKTANPTGSFENVNTGSKTKVPEVAASSSRGPSLAGVGGDADSRGGAFIKPDISAPGTDVLAAYSSHDLKVNFGQISGTSMASPHIAGLAALIKQARPNWTPMMIKSAMMTTTRKMAGEKAGDLFAEGAGFVQPREFLFPGLVYDSGVSDWMNFLKGQGINVKGTAIKAYDLNYPSISVGQLVGKVTVKRTVTNVMGAPMVFTPKVEGLSGFDVDVNPKRMFVGANKKADYTVTITRKAEAPLNKWAMGSLTWTDMNMRTVRSPIAVRPTALSTETEVSVPQGTTELKFPVTVGSPMTLNAGAQGLVEGIVTRGEASKDKKFTTDFKVTTPLNRARLQTKLLAGFDKDDLDIYVTRKGSEAKLAQAATETGNETIDLGLLTSGEYTLHVEYYDGAQPTSKFDTRVFVMPFRDAGNLTFNPKQLKLGMGETGTFVATAKIDPTKVYFGTVQYFADGAPTKPLATTLVTIG